MPNKLFGIADPYYDALRVQSNQAIWPDAGGSTSGIGGTLENKIYVWHTDGSPIDLFDPTEAGLNAALAAAATGDTVWLPSMTISILASITLAVGVMLRGIDTSAIIDLTAADALDHSTLIGPASGAAYISHITIRCTNTGGGGGGGSFPTTSVLDDFNRANEGPPPSANWINGPITEWGSGHGLKVNTNEAQASNLTFGGGSAWSTQKGPDVEVYATLTAGFAALNSFILYWRLSDPTHATLTYGYRLFFYNDPGGTTFAVGVDSLNGTVVSTVALYFSNQSGQLAAGNKIGVSHIGDLISVYIDQGSGWTLITSFTDSTYTGAGYIAAGMSSTSSRLDNFGGGDVAPTVGDAIALDGGAGQVFAHDSYFNGQSSGANGYGVRSAAGAIALDDCWVIGSTAPLSSGAGTIFTSGVRMDTVSGEPTQGDRSAWDTTGFPARHAKDISDSTFTYHLKSATTQAYTVSNPATDRAYDVTATTLNELAAVIGTLIADLRAKGLLS